MQGLTSIFLINILKNKFNYETSACQLLRVLCHLIIFTVVARFLSIVLASIIL